MSRASGRCWNPSSSTWTVAPRRVSARRPARCRSGTHQHRDTGQRPRQHQRLVAGAVEIGAQARAVGDDHDAVRRACAARTRGSASRAARRARSAGAPRTRRPASCPCRRRGGCPTLIDRPAAAARCRPGRSHGTPAGCGRAGVESRWRWTWVLSSSAQFTGNVQNVAAGADRATAAGRDARRGCAVLAPRLASTRRRGPPRPGGRGGCGSTAGRSATSSSSRADGHLDGGLLRAGTCRRSRRSSACAGRRQSPCPAPPARGCCGRPCPPGCRRRTPPWPAGRRAPVRQSYRERRRRRGVRRRRASAVRRTVRKPACRASASTSANRSGRRGARISSASVVRSVRTRSKLRSRISSSPGNVLPATMTGRRLGAAEEAQHPVAAAAAGGCAGQVQGIELQAAGDTTRSGGAPRSIRRPRDSSPCTQK